MNKSRYEVEIPFYDRTDAGAYLAQSLMQYKDSEAVVIALPRGGVPVGYQVAHTLYLPLDVIIARKIGAPRHEEFGIGAISEEDVTLFDIETIEGLSIDRREIQPIFEKEKKELARRVQRYRGGKDLSYLKNKTVILVDDGLATGVTARAAVKALKKLKVGKIVFAVPVCAEDSARFFEHEVDEFICLVCPVEFNAVGLWYAHFPQTTDEEVEKLLKKRKEEQKKEKGRYAF